MRFAGNTSNVSSWIQAGKYGAKGAADAFKVARANAPDYGGLGEAHQNARKTERKAVTEAESNVARAGLKAIEDVRKTEITTNAKLEVNQMKADVKRKAGMVGMFGSVAGGAFLGVENKRAAKRQKERDAATDKREANKLAWMKERIDGTPEAPELTAWQGAEPPKSTPYVSSQDAGGDGTAAAPESTLSGSQKTVADAIAKYESGDWGYEAFNQGGANDGNTVVGKSGSHKDTFGRSLTDMTLGEIFKKQNTAQQGMSMQEHLDSGGLHAVGRYQFIGSTLQDEVSRLGLSHDTKFTPGVQDQIWLSHIKRVGDISPWVGPSNNYSADQKADFKNMIAGF